MDALSASNPKDNEAAIFHALSIISIADPKDKTYANQKRAAAILNRALQVEPQHPGVAHYIIHSFDYPELAPLALTAARRYAKLAPGSPHALHMPSHIFTRLGLWDESIASNLASAEKARSYMAHVMPGVTSWTSATRPRVLPRRSTRCAMRRIGATDCGSHRRRRSNLCVLYVSVVKAFTTEAQRTLRQ